jgi:disulfide oxidoreductase YuzD
MENDEEVSEVLLKIVELKTGIDREDILEANRKRKFVTARCIYVNLMHIFTDLTEMEISNKIKKDRATVYHMYRVHDDLISVDNNYINMFRGCSDKYVAMVCTAKYMLIDPAILMERVRKAELEIRELKEILIKRSAIQSNDELVTG